eukprot:scaffold11280_cov17-Tisochrysis_lutea.AAC.1
MNSPVADSSAIKVNSPVVDSSARNAIEANSPLAAPAHNPLATAADAGSVSTPLPGGHDSGTISGATLSPDQGPTPQVCVRKKGKEVSKCVGKRANTEGETLPPLHR